MFRKEGVEAKMTLVELEWEVLRKGFKNADDPDRHHAEREYLWKKFQIEEQNEPAL
jgi:hypothetical protein